ncbi:MAG: GNAT family N-acetyltransferase [bacterium]
MYEFSTQPRNGWEAFCDKNDAFMLGTEWHSVVEGAFKCQTVYAWDADSVSGLTVSIFRIGPFKIGYLNFPTGRSPGTQPVTMSTIHSLLDMPAELRPHCLRFAVSRFDSNTQLALPFRSQPESAITDLQSWSPSSTSKKLRRDLKKAGKAGFEISRIRNPSAGDTLFGIYQATVKLRGGSLRYNAAYFRSLITLSTRNHNLSLLAAEKDGQIAGFLVAIRHMETVYYMHGGTAPEFRRFSPSDLLVNSAIEWGQQLGAEQFNLMTSPDSQPSLVRYKEKWGAETRPHQTYTASINWPLCTLFRSAEKLHRFLR